MNISELLKKQRHYFNSNTTKAVDFRIEQLKKFKTILQENEALLYDAIYKDFGKSRFDTYVSELSLIYHELNLAIKRVKKWSRIRKARTNLVNFPARSYILPEPLGVSLIIGAWNYPYQLSLVPVLSSLAAGNTVILKPSELPANTARVMAELINQSFDSQYFHVVEGGVSVTTELLEQRFDKIFFTGSIPVGKIVHQAAARHLTPVTLELGGKSPAFIMADCNMKMTVRRLIWSKFLNAGQTCVAPDYVLIEKAAQELFLELAFEELARYPKDFSAFSDHYTRIINDKNVDRLSSLIDPDKVCYGGNVDRDNRFIAPTIMKDVTFDDPIMEDEIFGPILPVITFNNLEDAIQKVKNRPKPLSLYVYSKSKKTVNTILSQISFGGGAVNDSVMHLVNSHLPFGGVGSSGMGSYHAKTGFDTFSHHKSILKKPFWFELGLKYPPYNQSKLTWIKRIMNR